MARHYDHLNTVFEHDLDVRSRTIFIHDDIESDNVRGWIKALKLLEKISQTSPIHIYISSAGGDTMEGFALYDELRQSPCVIKTRAMGGVSSMAVCVYLAGQERTIGPNAKIMVHAGTGFAIGDIEDLKIEYNESVDLEKRAINLFAERTKKPEAYWKKITKTRYFNAEESVKVGLAHSIFDFPEEV